MADDTLPNEYDAIVLGTGMTECIIAAALSRIGQRVLHLDRNDYYSGDWGTFHFEAIQKWITKQQGIDKEPLTIKPPKEDSTQEGEFTLPLKVESTSVSNVAEHVYIPEELMPEKVAPTEQGDKDEVVEKEVDTKIPVEGDHGEKDSTGEQNSDQVDSKEGQEQLDETEKEEETKSASVEETQEEKEPAEKEWCFKEMKKQWRKFNIDLQPKMLYCRGSMVELLISSDIAKYCEFKSITRVLTFLNDKLEKVPCSRADVFSSKQVSMIEKRMLMKLLTFCMEFDKHPEEYEGFEDKTFDDFLAARKLTANVRHYVKYSIAMATSKTTTLEGLISTQKFLQSLGRYGNTAFLWPLYGSGEMPQCFCRMCAVFGGIYCLRRTGVSLIVDKDKKCKGIIDSEGQRLDAKWVILESSYTTGDMLPKEKPGSISRAIFVVDRSLQSSDGEQISLLRLPHGDEQENMINVIELSPTSMACPKHTHLVHMTCKGIKGPKEDFSTTVQRLFQPTGSDEPSPEDGRPRVLWSLYFSQEDTSGLPLNDHGLQDVFVVATPDAHIDFDRSIQEARHIFEQICPGEDFLPRAPNPEDIIYDDDQQGPNPEGSGFEPAPGDQQEGKGENKEAGQPSASDTREDKSEIVSDESTPESKQSSENQPEESDSKGNVHKENTPVDKS